MAERQPVSQKVAEAVEATLLADAKRVQDIRLECLKCAVTGTGGGQNTDSLLTRAQAFEDWVTGGKKSEPPSTQRAGTARLLEDGRVEVIEADAQ